MTRTRGVQRTRQMHLIIVGIVLFALLMAIIVAEVRMQFGDSDDHPPPVPIRSAALPVLAEIVDITHRLSLNENLPVLAIA